MISYAFALYAMVRTSNDATIFTHKVFKYTSRDWLLNIYFTIIDMHVVSKGFYCVDFSNSNGTKFGLAKILIDVYTVSTNKDYYFRKTTH